MVANTSELRKSIPTYFARKKKKHPVDPSGIFQVPSFALQVHNLSVVSS